MHGEDVGSHHHLVVAKVRNSLAEVFKAGVERGECGGQTRAGRRIRSELRSHTADSKNKELTEGNQGNVKGS